MDTVKRLAQAAQVQLDEIDATLEYVEEMTDEGKIDPFVGTAIWYILAGDIGQPRLRKALTEYKAAPE